MLGCSVDAFSGKRISAVGGELSEALSGSIILAQKLSSTDFQADGEPAAEIRDRERLLARARCSEAPRGRVPATGAVLMGKSLERKARKDAQSPQRNSFGPRIFAA